MQASALTLPSPEGRGVSANRDDEILVDQLAESVVAEAAGRTDGLYETGLPLRRGGIARDGVLAGVVRGGGVEDGEMTLQAENSRRCTRINADSNRPLSPPLPPGGEEFLETCWHPRLSRAAPPGPGCGPLGLECP